MGYWGHSKFHDDAWRWLFDELKPGLALLQECVIPDWVHDRAHVRFGQAYPKSHNQKWGTALVAIGIPFTPVTLDAAALWFEALGPHATSICSATRLSSWLVGGQIKLDESEDLLVFSLHNPAYPIDRKLLESVDVSNIKLTQNPDVWLQDVVFYFLRENLNGSLIVGGDFNTSRLLDEPKPRGNTEFFERLEQAGFVSLHRLFHDVDVQTYFHPKSRPHQLDYLYSDATIAAKTIACNVLYAPPRFSDHAPLVAEITLINT